MVTIQKYLDEATKQDPLLDRAYLFLEDGEWTDALAYFERVLDQNARSPFAYLGKLLVKIQAKSIDGIALCEQSYTENSDFTKALRFSEGELHDALSKLAEHRDGSEEAYQKAVEAEKNATDIDAFVAVYQLYENAGDYKDAKEKVRTIKEALSVLAYYSSQGMAKIIQSIEGARNAQDVLGKQLAALNTLISTQQKMLPTLRTELSKREFELSNLGWFKKKRKAELESEIEEGKKAIDELEKSIRKNQKQRATVSSQLSQCGEALALQKAFDFDLQGQNISPNKNDIGELPILRDVELLSFEDNKEPLRILKKKGILGVVAKNALALYALLQDEEVQTIIQSNKKNAESVGSSPVFVKIVPFLIPIVKKIDTLHPYLPVGFRVALEATMGDVVTFGQFPEGGRDPYSDIIPMPGTKYHRSDAPVKWFVLKRNGTLLTLIPTAPLLYRNFEEVGRDTMTWSNSEMRKYMQGEMFELLFQGEERDMVVPVQIDMGGIVTTDKLALPSFDEVLSVYSKMEKTERHIWTRDYIEISSYNNSLLVQVSVFSMKYREKWKLLVHNYGGVLPVVTIKVPLI